jgi:hypothetical protein
MALKTKNPPALPDDKPAPSISEERMLRVNPEVDRRLDGFMQANSKLYFARKGTSRTRRACFHAQQNVQARGGTARRGPSSSPGQGMARAAGTKSQKACDGAAGKNQSVLSREGARARHRPGEDPARLQPKAVSRPRHVGLMARREGRPGGKSRPPSRPSRSGGRFAQRRQLRPRLPRQSGDLIFHGISSPHQRPI